MTAITPTQSKSTGWLIPGLALLIAGLIALNLAQFNLPLVSNDRLVLIVVVVLGQVLCSLGMRIGTFRWSHPSTILGIILGILLYAVVLLHLFGVALPYLTTDRSVLVFLAAVMLVKILVDVIRMQLRGRSANASGT